MRFAVLVETCRGPDRKHDSGLAVKIGDRSIHALRSAPISPYKPVLPRHSTTVDLSRYDDSKIVVADALQVVELLGTTSAASSKRHRHFGVQRNTSSSGGFAGLLNELGRSAFSRHHSASNALPRLRGFQPSACR